MSPDLNKTCLTGVEDKIDRLVLETRHGDSVWRHTYQLRNKARHANLLSILKVSIGQSMEQIGNCEVDVDFNRLP